MEIRPGTPVECLICMQSFAAAQPSPAALETPTPAVAKAPTPPTGIAVAQKAKATPPPLPFPKTAKVAPTPGPRREVHRTSGKLAFVLLALGALFVIIVGSGIGAWFVSLPTSVPTEPSPLGQIAASGNAETPDAGKPGNAVAGPEEVDDDLRRKKEAEKKLLARKDPIKPIGNDLEFDPISTLKVSTPAIPGLDQQKINAAIDKGVNLLKRAQHPFGHWSFDHELGNTALGGLTLLECGVPANDLHVQRAASLVRMKAADHRATYEISLAVLFLDRLGDPRDRPLIQWIALRILAGQNDSGGWTYHCPTPAPQELFKLYSFLQARRPAVALHNPIVNDSKPPLRDPLAAEPNYSAGAFQEFNQMVSAGNTDTATPPKKGAKTPPTPKAKTPTPVNPLQMVAELRNLPVVLNQGKKKGQPGLRMGGGDNSNTQFALLALWVARRHAIPTDAALVFSHLRFQMSQCPDGGWGYTHQPTNSTKTMTCVGLLGEAMGHGAAPDVIGFNPKNPKVPIIKPVLEDPAIKKALAHLATHIGQPSKDDSVKNFSMQNLYFLWSVERVAMLYDLNTINGKDWYGWGAQILVHNQQPSGGWVNGQYPGESEMHNTCFALLFLRRSNLVQDLTNNLRLYSAIRDPG